MKYIIPIGFALLLLAFSQLSSRQKKFVEQNYSDTIPSKKSKTAKQNKKELIYDFPDGVTTDTGKASFVKLFFKGKAIYKQTCAKCHNVTKEDGQVFYPDFSLPQLMDYEMRFQYPEHQEDLKETNITVEELDWVVLFLRYKKKNQPVGNK
jgi:hypothetical protein